MSRLSSAPLLILCTLAVAPVARVAAYDDATTGPTRGAPRLVYDDALASDFQDWSWATHDLASTNPVAVGSFAISMEPDGWQGVFLHANAPISVSEWGGLRFRYHGGSSGGQALRVYLDLGGSLVAEMALAPPGADAWQERTIDFAALGASGSFDGIVFQDGSGGDQAAVHFDQIELLPGVAPPPGGTVTVSVEPALDRRAIDPRIYGVNFGGDQQVNEVGWPLRRWGGNATTRYNWRFDVFNTASDYFFQNIVNDVADPSALPFGSSSDGFVAATLAAGSEPIVTVPMIGWAPIDVREKRWGFSQAAYGAQTDDECRFNGFPFWCTEDSGNGLCDPAVNTTGFCSAQGEIFGNDPTDTSQPIGAGWVSDWVEHLTDQFGLAAEGGPRLWALDNEPMLWNSTHRDLFPDGLDYDGLWSRTLSYAQAVKAVDPGARTLGPAVWGWCAYFTSAADAELPGSNCVDGPDRQAHGGLPLLEWLLEQTCTHEANTGFRAIDYLDVHFYPQGGVAGLGSSDSSEDPATSARRLRSTRELWDPAYVSESWIGQPVRLIPRLREWVDARCPGTGLALTEYRWGADDGLSGALAQVEVLALLGREGVDLATRWVAPEAGTLVEEAFRLFLDYDGAGARVEGTSVRATSSELDAVVSYAVEGASDLYVVLVNKDTSMRPIVADLSAALESDVGAEFYRLDSSGLAEVAGPGVMGGSLALDLPARSATLVVVQHGGALFADGFELGDTSAWSAAVP